MDEYKSGRPTRWFSEKCKTGNWDDFSAESNSNDLWQLLWENKTRFLTSDLTNRNKKQRTLIVRRAGYPAGAALVGIGKKPKPRDSRWMFCSGSEFGNWLQMALGFGKNLGLFLPSPKTQALCDFEKRSGVRIGLESLFRSNLFHQDHHLQYGSRPWWSMTGNSNWWVGIESSQSGMSS